MLHIALHFVFPAILTSVFFRKSWKISYCLMIATMLVDIDHIFATPLYDPARCSIGFHPLHQLWLIVVYGTLSFIPKTRIVGIGLSVHMALDAVDCQLTNGVWTS